MDFIANILFWNEQQIALLIRSTIVRGRHDIK